MLKEEGFESSWNYTIVKQFIKVKYAWVEHIISSTYYVELRDYFFLELSLSDRSCLSQHTAQIFADYLDPNNSIP